MTDVSAQEPPAKAHNRLSPALLIFLVFPLVGLVAAAITILSSGSATNVNATPEPVTLPPPKVLADAPMINFTLTSLDGKTVSLSDYQGRDVFLNFWATTCIPCQKELPAFQQFQATQPADGAAILAVNMLEGKDQVKGYLDGLGVSGLTILLDSDGTVSDNYGIFNIPVTFVIDKNGIVRYPKYGPMSVDDLQSYVTALEQQS